LNGWYRAEFPQVKIWPRNLFVLLGVQVVLLSFAFPKKGPQKSCARMAKNARPKMVLVGFPQVEDSWAGANVSHSRVIYNSNY
jgi:hypothetical protein